MKEKYVVRMPNGLYLFHLCHRPCVTSLDEAMVYTGTLGDLIGSISGCQYAGAEILPLSYVVGLPIQYEKVEL